MNDTQLKLACLFQAEYGGPTDIAMRTLGIRAVVHTLICRLGGHREAFMFQIEL